MSGNTEAERRKVEKIALRGAHFWRHILGQPSR